MALIDDVKKAGGFKTSGAEKKWLKDFSARVSSPQSAEAKTALVHMCVIAVHRIRHRDMVAKAPRFGKVLPTPEPPSESGAPNDD